MKSKVLATNRKARHEYHILETMEAGIELIGSEVKSLRAGRVSVKESYCSIDHGEMFVYGMHITPYQTGGFNEPDPLRKRKLLLHRREINRLLGAVKEKGLTLVPLSLYLKSGRVKVEIALVKGKKLYDKRESLQKREAEIKIRRAVKERY